MWNCPRCNRQFKHQNQQHSCVVVSPESFFENKPKDLFDAYQKIIALVKGLGPVRISAVKSEILVSGKGTAFLGIKPRKDYLEIEFALDRVEDVFPIYKTFKFSKKLTVHYLRLQHPDEVNDQLVGWLREAWELS